MIRRFEAIRKRLMPFWTVMACATYLAAVIVLAPAAVWALAHGSYGDGIGIACVTVIAGWMAWIIWLDLSGRGD